MSRYSFRLHDDDDKVLTVVLGYDRPLNYVFCTVTREGEEDRPIYTNLADPGAGTHQRDVEYYRPILARLGIEVPERMFREVMIDRALRTGNRNRDYTRGE